MQQLMGATEMEQLAMEISGKALWVLGDYSLQVNREGYLEVTFPVLAARNLGLGAGDAVTAYLHRPTGALLLAPTGAEFGGAEA